MTYKEYVAECEQNGVEPLEMPKWRSDQARAAKTEQPDEMAELKAELEAQKNLIAAQQAQLAAKTPAPEHVIPIPAEQLESNEAARLNDMVTSLDARPQKNDLPTTLPEHPIFFCDGRFHQEVVYSGVVVHANQHVEKVHNVIEFMEYHWTPDMENPKDVEKAEWLLKSKSFRVGKITLVPDFKQTKNVTVTDGPRTHAVTSPQRSKPLGELSAPLT